MAGKSCGFKTWPVTVFNVPGDVGISTAGAAADGLVPQLDKVINATIATQTNILIIKIPSSIEVASIATFSFRKPHASELVQ
jgi:hypothetical protein